MPAFLTPDPRDQWLDPEKATGQAKLDTLEMLERTSADVAATLREYIVDTKVNNTRTVDSLDPSLIEPMAA